MTPDIEHQAWKLLGRLNMVKSRQLARRIGVTAHEVGAACSNSNRIIGETPNNHTAKTWRRG